jgi:lysophospholipase L1-like esterase
MRQKIMTYGLIAGLALSGLLNLRFITNHYRIQESTQSGMTETTQIALRTKQAKIHLYEDMGLDSNDVVFAGNSLTEGFPVMELFRTLHVKNRGVSGATLDDMNELIPFLLKHHPSKMFLEIGINDLKNDIDHLDEAKKRLLKNYETILASPRTTKIYVQSLLPVNSLYFHDQTDAINKAIIEINDSLKIYAGSNYVDLYSTVKGEKGLQLKYTTDGLHLNEEGYKVWFEKIKGLI